LTAEHVAIKCTYNNGDEGIYVGFNGTCSESVIKYNIESGRVWCSQKDCECREYYDAGFKGERPKPSKELCYESVLFRDWSYGAGWFHTGQKAGTPMHLKNVGEGKIAILTTRFPYDEEIDRRIVGLFKIGEVKDKEDKETWLIANRRFRVRLPMEEAQELCFWDYYSTEGGAKWGTGLARYLTNEQVSRILFDLKATARDEKAREGIERLITEDFSGEIPPPASGVRARGGVLREKRVLLNRKYGASGEGIDHKELKMWIAHNPQEIGISGITRKEIEYVFQSGDVADIVFSISGNRYAIVEIETAWPFPGAYQALKYRVLKCAEEGLDIMSQDVEAILVSWSIPKEVRRFCEKYGIRFVEKKLRT